MKRKALLKPVAVIFSIDKELATSIKNIFGFYPKNVFLYRLALRHKSVAEEINSGMRVSNERLEYLGDAVLGSIVADFLFKIFPFKDEGFLTDMRSKIVNRDHLNKLSQKLGIDRLVNHDGNIYRSAKGDAFEALIGAIYLDKGYNFTKKIVINNIIKCHVDIEELPVKEINFKSKLIEWAQQQKKSVEFSLRKELGNGHKKQYLVEIFIEKSPFTTGQDFTIKKAEQNAAEKALNLIFGQN